MSDITEHDLQVCIKAHREGKVGDEQILRVFEKLAAFVLARKGWQLDKPESVLADTAVFCLEKLAKYDNSKAKAFNFFVTIIGCWLGQIRRMQMNSRRKSA